MAWREGGEVGRVWCVSQGGECGAIQGSDFIKFVSSLWFIIIQIGLLKYAIDGFSPGNQSGTTVTSNCFFSLHYIYQPLLHNCQLGILHLPGLMSPAKQDDHSWGVRLWCQQNWKHLELGHVTLWILHWKVLGLDFLNDPRWESEWWVDRGPGS